MSAGNLIDFYLKLDGTTYKLCNQDSLLGFYGQRFPV